MKTLGGISVFVCIAFPIAYLVNVTLASPIAGTLAFLIAVLTWVAPTWVPLLLVALAPLGRSPASQLISFQLLVYTKVALTTVFALVWGVKHCSVWPRRAFPGWLTALFLGWAALAVVSTLHSENPAGSLPHLAACAASMLFFMTLWHSDEALDRKIAWMTLAGAIAITALSFVQYLALKYRLFPSLWNLILPPRERLFMQINWTPIGDQAYRVSGPLPHPNALGDYYYLVIPFVAASLSLVALGKWQRRGLMMIFLLMLAGLYATNSRTGFLAVGISLMFLSVHRGCRWLMGLGTACLLILSLLYVRDSEALANYVQTVGRTEYGISSRGTIWANAMDLFRRYAWLGLGPGQFTRHYNADFGLFIFDNAKEIFEQTLLLQTEREDLIEGYHAHNTYLQLICEYGILSLPLFLFGILSVLIASERRALHLPVGSFGRAMALGSASFCASYLVAAFFDSYVTFTYVGLVFLAVPLIAMGLRSA